MPKYCLEYSSESLDDIEKLRKTGNKLALKKIDIFLEELKEHPRTGTGHPERLKGFFRYRALVSQNYREA